MRNIKCRIQYVSATGVGCLINIWEEDYSGSSADQTKTGADVSNPPDNTHGNTFDQMSLADKMKYANEHPDDTGVKAWLNK